MYVYILRSLRDGKLYTGIAKDPESRLVQHNLGMTKSTKGRRPFELIYKEERDTVLEARQRERYLKTGHGRQDLKNLIPCSSAGRAAGC